jgi:hypothetical protein
MVYFNGTLFFGGLFTGTTNTGSVTGLSNIAAYDTSNNVWKSLGQGLNGNVTNLVLYAMPTGSSTNETILAVSGEFTQINASPEVNAPGFALWIPSSGNWAEVTGAGVPAVEGSVAAETASTNGTVFIAGAISSWQEQQAQGVIGLSDGSLDSIPLVSSTPTNSTKKRSLNSADSTSTDVVITTGTFYTANGSNLTVLAGHFSFSGVQNLAFVNGSNDNTVTGLPSNALSNASIYALLVDSNRLYIGGDFTANIGSNLVDALAFYDFSTNAFSTIQPPPLTGEGVVIVNALELRPNNPQVLVGGRFAQAGSLPCPAVCIFNTGNSQWNRPGSETIDGEVSQILFEDENTGLVVGNISIGGNRTYVGRFDFTSSSWSSVNAGVTGPVESVLSQDGTLFLVGTNSSGTYFGKSVNGDFQDLSNSSSHRS